MNRAFAWALTAALVACALPAAPLGGIESAQAQEAVESAALLAPAVVEADAAIDADAGLVAQAANDEKFQLQGPIRYDDIHTLVGLINQERSKAGLGYISLDATLTESSILRAAELMVYFSHTRPNGEAPNTTIPVDKRTTIVEISALDLSSPAAFMQACFYDEKALFDKGVTDLEKTGHYQTMMSKDFKSVGIGNFSQGVTSWNLMFSERAASGSVAGGNRTLVRDFYVDYDLCGKRQEFNLNTPLENMQRLNVDQTYRMYYDVATTIPNSSDATNIFARLYPNGLTWTSSNPSVCTVDATGTVTARAAGTATITARLGSGKSVSHTWTVSQGIGSATGNITVPDQTYTGSPIEPRPTIRSGNRTLVEGTDYALSYAYNTNIGIASMTITGLGSFTGTRTFEFRIRPAENWAVSLSEYQYLYDGTEKRPAVAVTYNGMTLQEAVDGRGDYTVAYPGDVTSEGTHTITVMGIGNYAGEQQASYSITPEPVSTEERDVMYRLYNPNSGEHFYTASVGERDAIAGAGWTYEGVGWIAPKWSNEPVYRLYSGTDHHYTTSAEERDVLIGAGWILEGDGPEGIAWYSEDSGDDAKRLPLYRQFNPNVDPGAPFNNSGSHNYTMDKAENDILVQNGWIEEGVGWYGIRQ